MATKIYCDICKKEVKGYGNLAEIKITPNEFGKEATIREEICKPCAEKIRNFINSIRIKW